MREIIFRAKRIDENDFVNGMWAYGDFVHEFMDLGPCISAHENVKNAINYGYMPVDPETVGQYTGLADKNGQKIFEGDVVQAGCKMLVTWDGKFASWCLKRQGWAYKHFFGEAVSPEDCEVIGNRWDNPELLEGVKE